MSSPRRGAWNVMLKGSSLLEEFTIFSVNYLMAKCKSEGLEIL